MSATPAASIIFGWIISSAISRRSIRESFSEVIPNPRTELAEDVNGVIFGVEILFGSWLSTRANCSVTNCRFKNKFWSSSKIIVITDNPGDDCDLMDFTPIKPDKLDSIALLTNNSVSSAEKPDDSVWITICAGANSGKMSNFAVFIE